VELYNNRFIAYSLGNFCTYARFNLSGANGIAPMVEIRVNSQGEFLGGKVHAIKQVGEGGPLFDEELRAVKQLIELSAADFPESPLIIEADGTLKRRQEP
jgi:poly-gamma-glutamate capsule biosynthesis protein CapA/YwtB (metallophosphatase superfamily)